MEFEPIFTEDKRASKRVRFIDSVLFKEKDNPHFGGSVGFDISEGGLRMSFNDYVPIGTELSLQIQLSNGNVVECVGRIVWVKKYPYSDHYQAGVQFESPENLFDSRSKIHQYIELFPS